MSHPGRMVRVMTIDTHHLEALHALEQYKQTPKTVRAEVRAALTGYERARVLVEQLEQSRRDLEQRLPDLEQAAGEALAAVLSDHNAQRVPVELVQSIAEPAAEIDRLDLEHRLAVEALRAASRRLTEPVERWGRHGALWAANERVELGPDSTAVPLAVSYVWSQLRPPAITVPAALVSGRWPSEMGGPLETARRPDMRGPVARPSRETMTPSASETDRLIRTAYERSLAGWRADWFALCCYAAGQVRAGQNGLETTAELDRFEVLEVPG